MSERIELRVHDFLAEGRDESKSHVLLEITQPAANEVATHGHFFAIAELVGATPKTIQMVRSWIEFAIESYYKSTPTNIESHFETILGQLNTQSSLYLKQHAHEEINIAVAATCNSTLYLATHGRPAALLFYKKNEGWQSLDMIDPDAADIPGQLFSNVINGVMRVDDRFLLATPRVTEFFTADRLAKICEGKSMQEVNDHMLRILSDLSSEYSFGGVWLRLVRAFDETKEIMQQKIPAGSIVRPEKKSDVSMDDLMKKTRTTAEILAPPILTIPKDKIITNSLMLIQSNAIRAGKFLTSAVRSTTHAISSKKSSPTTERITPKQFLNTTKNSLGLRFSAMPKKRKYVLVAAITTMLLAVIIVGIIAYSRSRTAQTQSVQTQLTVIRDTLRSANESFTYQNESAARTTLSQAKNLLSALPESTKTAPDGTALQTEITDATNKILHITSVTPITPAFASALTIRDITTMGTSAIALSTTGDIVYLKDGLKKIATVDAATEKIFSDESSKRLFVMTKNHTFKTIALDGNKTTDVVVNFTPENTHTKIANIYSDRLYTYDSETNMIYRYEHAGDAYTNGKRWIVDKSGNPTNIADFVVDNSIWMRSTTGGILKYTAGKLQTFKISNLEPDTTHIDQILTSASDKIYFLDSQNHRIVQTERDGKLITQFVYPESTHITRIALDKTETTATGISDDGRVVQFALSK